MVWWLSIGLVACTAEDPLLDLDERYLPIAVDLGAADRDISRNVRNKEARLRKGEAERQKVAFFHDPAVQQVLAQLKEAAPSDPTRKAKAEGYWRDLVQARSWTEEEKTEETRLVGALEELLAVEATWASPDGLTQVRLDQGNWTQVSRDADGLDAALREALLQEYVDHRMSAVGAELQSLVRLRNEVARREGFSNHWEMSLAAQGLQPSDVDTVIADVRRAIAPILAEVSRRIDDQARVPGLPATYAHRPLLRRKAGLDSGRDGADAYADADLAEERVFTALQDMGFDTSAIQVHTGPSRTVRSGVYGFAVRPPQSVAVVMAIDERWSVRPYELLAHETGHAVWWASLPADAASSPVLWNPPAPWFEGWAQFFEGLATSREFTDRYLTEMPEAERDRLEHGRRFQLAEELARYIVDVETERRLYEDPTNLAAVARASVEAEQKLFGYNDLPPSSSNGMAYTPTLASGLVVNYPGYSQNYLFATTVEAWMRRIVEEDLGGTIIGNPKVGATFIDKVVRAAPGKTFPERLEDLDPDGRANALASVLEMPPAAAEMPTATAP